LTKFSQLVATDAEYDVDMSRIRPQCLDADCSDRLARSDVFLRDEPDEEEDDPHCGMEAEMSRAASNPFIFGIA
jgi:hypothetical protein